MQWPHGREGRCAWRIHVEANGWSKARQQTEHAVDRSTHTLSTPLPDLLYPKRLHRARSAILEEFSSSTASSASRRTALPPVPVILRTYAPPGRDGTSRRGASSACGPVVRYECCSRDSARVLVNPNLCFELLLLLLLLDGAVQSQGGRMRRREVELGSEST
jgi:hypothetical protein